MRAWEPVNFSARVVTRDPLHVATVGVHSQECTHTPLALCVAEPYNAPMNMKVARVILPLAVALVAPTLASAQLVTCSGSDCSWADLVQLADNILDLIITVAIIASAIMFAYVGFLLFSDSGNMENVKKGKKVFMHVVVGLVIVLVAWLIIDTILDVLTGEGLEERRQDIGA